MTQLLYLSDTYQMTGEAKVLSVETNEHGTALILDQTIFYPQGGGQPFDIGTITFGEMVFAVDNVRLSPEGVVYHYGTFSQEGDLEGQTVQLQIDEERRMLHAKIHTAGHLLDIAVTKVGLDQITPTKGFHNPEGAYVEYEGELEEAASFIEPIEVAVNALVSEDLKVIAEDLSYEVAQERGVFAPPGKSARFVYFEGYEQEGCGCGGTHVRSTSELGPITVRKIKSKKGVTRISYALSS